MTNLERLDLPCVALSQWNEPVVRKNLVGITPQSFRVDIRDAIHLRVFRFAPRSARREVYR
jgi:hypothetical protein